MMERSGKVNHSGGVQRTMRSLTGDGAGQTFAEKEFRFV
jgi:hypothetical protein